MTIKTTIEKWKSTVKRWITNLKWLFNHPTTNWTSVTPPNVRCDYCGSDNSFITHVWSNGLRSTVCWNCIFKALDLALMSKK